MLYPDYFSDKADRMVELYSQLEEWILRDIARRMMESGKLPATADRLVWKLMQMGEHRREILKRLSRITGLAEEEIRKLLQEAVLTSWKDDAETLDQLNLPLLEPLNNPAVIEVMNAEYQKTLGELRNLTRTTLADSASDLVRMLDAADMQVAAGVQSYEGAIAEILDRYAAGGSMVTYPTGRRMGLESAVRMVVVTSMNQTAAQVSNQYVKEAGTNYVLTSAHYGARIKKKGQPPLAGHDLWQGMVFCIRGSEPGIPNLLEATGYDIDPETGRGRVVNPLGLHGYNCRHSHKPWDKRLRNPWRDEEGNLVDGNGNLITSEENRRVYELQQKQRGMEREIRRTKRLLIAKEEEIKAETDPTLKAHMQADYARISDKLVRQNREYNAYCKAHKLAPGYARTKTLVHGQNMKERAKADLQRMERARQIKGLDDLRKVSKSSIITMKTHKEIVDYFRETHGISLKGFEEKQLFDVQTVFAGADDILTEFPEIKKNIKEIVYNPKRKIYGEYAYPDRIIQIGPKGLNYGTGVHECSHALDVTRSEPLDIHSYSRYVVETARKNLKIRANSKEYLNLRIMITGDPADAKLAYEVFAFAIETAVSGIDNRLAKEILRLVRGE